MITNSELENLKERFGKNVYKIEDQPDIPIHALVDEIQILRRQNGVLRECLEASVHGEGWKNCPSCTREESAKKALEECEKDV